MEKYFSQCGKTIRQSLESARESAFQGRWHPGRNVCRARAVRRAVGAGVLGEHPLPRALECRGVGGDRGRTSGAHRLRAAAGAGGGNPGAVFCVGGGEEGGVNGNIAADDGAGASGAHRAT